MGTDKNGDVLWVGNSWGATLARIDTKTLETKIIPEGFDYSDVCGLRTEAKQKLAKLRPSTIAQAGRISGISPADVGLLLVHLRRVPASVPEVCE